MASRLQITWSHNLATDPTVIMRKLQHLILLLAVATAFGCIPRNLETPPAPAPGTTAGTVVDVEHIGQMPVPGSPMVSADVYRFAYVTESDESTIATARLAVPVGLSSNYDMVAHLHGTIGFADHCAPSRMPGFGFESPLNPIPADMVADGRVLVMPDYPGLGTEGRHRYIEKVPTGRSVWDALIAARTVVAEHHDAQASGRLIVMGHSQGGHATLATLATQRASDPFELVGAVAFAPPGDPLEHAAFVARGEARAAPFAWALKSYSRAYPELATEPLFERWVDDSLTDVMDNYCVATLNVWLGDDPDEIFSAEAMEMFASKTPSPNVEMVLDRERLDDFDTDAELLVYHGTEDRLLPSVLSRNLVERLSSRGNDVTWNEVDGAGHLTVPYYVRDEVGLWANRRLGPRGKAL